MSTDKMPEKGKSDILEKIAEIPALVCGSLLIAAACLVSVEVVLRKLFSFSIGGADELSSYVLALTTAWGFSLAVVHRAHIRIDVLYQKLNMKIRSYLDVIAALSMVMFSGYLAYFCWSVISVTIRRGSTANTPLQTPLIIPQGLWFLGLLVFYLVSLFVLAKAVKALLAKDYAGVNAVAGVRTSDDELEEAMQQFHSNAKVASNEAENTLSEGPKTS